MTKTYITFEDCFTVTCNKCGSTDVSINSDYCDECGSMVGGTCNKCGNKFDYHEFKQKELNNAPKTEESVPTKK